MSLLVVGSTALDSLSTPHGNVESILGGSSVYFSLAASFFSPVRMVSVVGEDFPEKYRKLLEDKSVDTRGMVEKPGKTFRWDGRYEGAMNEAETLDVQLNVFGDFMPEVPDSFLDSPFVFLANSCPHTQLHVRRQVSQDAFVLADTMNLWIETEKETLLELFRSVDGVVLNDDEARQVSGEENLLRAGRWVCGHGPRCCVIKKAEHGAILIDNGAEFALPGYPTDSVYDPTGAGDSFAGGFLGKIAEDETVDENSLRLALAYGTVVASFTIESFGTGRLCEIGREDVEKRLNKYKACTQLPG